MCEAQTSVAHITQPSTQPAVIKETNWFALFVSSQKIHYCQVMGSFLVQFKGWEDKKKKSEFPKGYCHHHKFVFLNELPRVSRTRYPSSLAGP